MYRIKLSFVFFVKYITAGIRAQDSEKGIKKHKKRFKVFIE